MDKPFETEGVSIKVDCFSLAQTLECGQCFRFRKIRKNQYTVIANQKVLSIRQDNDRIVFSDTTEEEIEKIWMDYFDLKRNYGEVQKGLCQQDNVMMTAVGFAPGIHIVQQEFFECLISFIISQNNNIPRIKKNIETISSVYGSFLCERDGEKLYSFPTPEQLAQASEEELRQLNLGFRAKYIVDAVKKIVGQEIPMEHFSEMTTNELKKCLLTIYGVGPKVADCVMLFSLGRHEVFPTDVWIRRIMSHFYFDNKEIPLKKLQEMAVEKYGEYAGFAQQYLFHYARQQKVGK